MIDKNFDFLQDHSLHFLEMALSTERWEVPEDPDGHGKRTGDCGDTVEIFLGMRHGRVRHVNFRTDGCLNTNACANTVACLAEGRTLDEAWDITPQQVIDYLETLPPEKHHCAELAVGAFYLSLADARRRGCDAYRWRKP